MVGVGERQEEERRQRTIFKDPLHKEDQWEHTINCLRLLNTGRSKRGGHSQVWTKGNTPH